MLCIGLNMIFGSTLSGGKFIDMYPHYRQFVWLQSTQMSESGMLVSAQAKNFRCNDTSRVFITFRFVWLGTHESILV